MEIEKLIRQLKKVAMYHHQKSLQHQEDFYYYLLNKPLYTQDMEAALGKHNEHQLVYSAVSDILSWVKNSEFNVTIDELNPDDYDFDSWYLELAELKDKRE